jgi:hypothetical protein
VEIGKIEILKSFSFFEIENNAVAELAKALKNYRFMGRNLSVETALSDSGAQKKAKNKKKKTSARNKKKNK